MTNIGLALSLIVGTGALAWAYSQAGLEAAARWLLIIGLFWLAAYWRRWKRVSAWGLFVLIGFAAYGLWIGLPSSLMILGALGGLMAWDLAEFSGRLRYAGPTDDVREMEQRHIGRLVIVAILGTLLAGLTAVVRVPLTFEVVLGLVLVSAIGLAQLIRWLQSRGE